MITFVITQAASGGGVPCPFENGATLTQTCNTQTCVHGITPINCVGSFVSAVPCTKSCGLGETLFVFIITTEAQYGGVPCTHTNGEIQSYPCNSQSCASQHNCVGSFVATSCGVTCGGGTQLLTFTITEPASGGGVPCPYDNGTSLTQKCNTQTCVHGVVPVNCVGSFVSSVPCTKTCGNGSELFVFIITTEAQNGGQPCAHTNGEILSTSCNSQSCALPQNCVGSFVLSETCSVSCGGGTETLTFIVTVPASNGGRGCAFANGTSNTKICNTQTWAFLSIHFAEWRPQIVCRRLMYRPGCRTW
jgi:hypothetical protein